jgi:D-aminopeptidase
MVSTAPLYRIDGPIDLELRLRTRFVAEWLSYLPEVARIDAYSIRYRAADIRDVSRFLMFLSFARLATAP